MMTDKDVVAVDGIDLEVRTGECFGLLGPNGAGKTTTIEICEGLTRQILGTSLCSACAGNQTPQSFGKGWEFNCKRRSLSERLTVAETVRLFRSFFRRGPEASEGSFSKRRPWYALYAGLMAKVRKEAERPLNAIPAGEVVSELSRTL